MHCTAFVLLTTKRGLRPVRYTKYGQSDTSNATVQRVCRRLSEKTHYVTESSKYWCRGAMKKCYSTLTSYSTLVEHETPTVTL